MAKLDEDDVALYYNLQCHILDLGANTICQKGLCTVEDRDLQQAIMHLIGFDLTRPISYEKLKDGVKYKSELTEAVYVGGELVLGYERQDKQWKLFGKENFVKFLHTEEGATELLQMIEDVKMKRNLPKPKRGRGRPVGTVKNKGSV